MTVEYDANGSVLRVDAVVISTQHAEIVTNEELCVGILKQACDPGGEIPSATCLMSTFNYHINPTGRFCDWRADGGVTGLTGREDYRRYLCEDGALGTVAERLSGKVIRFSESRLARQPATWRAVCEEYRVWRSWRTGCEV